MTKTVAGWGRGAVCALLLLACTEADESPLDSPREVSVVAIAGGGSHSLAIIDDGTLWAWGTNGQGRLGLGDFADRRSPEQVTN